VLFESSKIPQKSLTELRPCGLKMFFDLLSDFLSLRLTDINLLFAFVFYLVAILQKYRLFLRKTLDSKRHLW